jgi:hypothetical protein
MIAPSVEREGDESDRAVAGLAGLLRIYGTKRACLGMTWASILPKWREFYDVIKTSLNFGKSGMR